MRSMLPLFSRSARGAVPVLAALAFHCGAAPTDSEAEDESSGPPKISLTASIPADGKSDDVTNVELDFDMFGAEKLNTSRDNEFEGDLVVREGSENGHLTVAGALYDWDLEKDLTISIDERGPIDSLVSTVAFALLVQRNDPHERFEPITLEDDFSGAFGDAVSVRFFKKISFSPEDGTFKFEAVQPNGRSRSTVSPQHAPVQKGDRLAIFPVPVKDFKSLVGSFDYTLKVDVE